MHQIKGSQSILKQTNRDRLWFMSRWWLRSSKNQRNRRCPWWYCLYSYRNAGGMVMNSWDCGRNNTIPDGCLQLIQTRPIKSLVAWLKWPSPLVQIAKIHTNGKPDTTRANFHHTTSGTELRSIKKTLTSSCPISIVSAKVVVVAKWKYDITMIRKHRLTLLLKNWIWSTGKGPSTETQQWKKMHPDYKHVPLAAGNPGTGEDISENLLKRYALWKHQLKHFVNISRWQKLLTSGLWPEYSNP